MYMADVLLRGEVLDWVRTAAELGAGEILLTSMDADGTKTAMIYH